MNDRLGCVEGEGGATGGKEVGEVSNGVGIVGEDDNVVEIGENDDGRATGREVGEVVAEPAEGVADGEREEERGEGITLSNTGGRIHS
jgi:hypothetical protein